MASLDSLPPDQRAVLELVLRRGRNYDEIAELLSIDRAGVRERALAALDALGPQTGVPSERRALITDYLLGALPSGVADDVRERLASSPSERAWARVVAAELQSLASRPLPEIPAEAAPRRRGQGDRRGPAGAGKDRHRDRRAGPHAQYQAPTERLCRVAVQLPQRQPHPRIREPGRRLERQAPDGGRPSHQRLALPEAAGDAR